jgi:hypothetical protein
VSRVLFDGRVAGERLRVWVDDGPGGGFRVCSHAIGGALEQYFGRDEIETVLEVDAAASQAVRAALGGSGSVDELAAKFEGTPSANSDLRGRLYGVPYSLSVI